MLAYQEVDGLRVAPRARWRGEERRKNGKHTRNANNVAQQYAARGTGVPLGSQFLQERHEFIGQGNSD
ncbi:hypothetical protein D3C85_1844800 [compost metagenome]